MKDNKKSSNQDFRNKSSNVSEGFNDPQPLSESQKKNLQVKDGQHNHHVDERGGN